MKDMKTKVFDITKEEQGYKIMPVVNFMSSSHDEPEEEGPTEEEAIEAQREYETSMREQ
jgi:hypothetical protein